MRRVEIVIVGGGPAGSATASGLAALGRDVMLIERTAKPHNKVCGANVASCSSHCPAIHIPG